MTEDRIEVGWGIKSPWVVGNFLGVLRGRVPKLAGAEEKAKAEMACELIYKLGATLNGNDPLKLYLGPLALLSLDTPSLTSPCYMSPPPSNATVLVASRNP